MQVTWEAKIKEAGRPGVLTPTYTGDDSEVNREFLIKFWGLNEPDVESYELKRIK
jgi:hypothetical protein